MFKALSEMGPIDRRLRQCHPSSCLALANDQDVGRKNRLVPQPDRIPNGNPAKPIGPLAPMEWHAANLFGKQDPRRLGSRGPTTYAERYRSALTGKKPGEVTALRNESLLLRVETV